MCFHISAFKHFIDQLERYLIELKVMEVILLIRQWEYSHSTISSISIILGPVLTD